MKLTPARLAALPLDQLEPLRQHALKLAREAEAARKKHNGHASVLAAEIARRKQG